MAALPQSFDKHYFTVLVTAPHSKKLDHHLYIHLKYPRDVPKAFLKEFERLVDGFEKHVPTSVRHGICAMLLPADIPVQLAGGAPWAPRNRSMRDMN